MHARRHRHQEFIRFLNAVEKTVPATKAMHVILDNYAAHKHPKVIGLPATRASPSTSTDQRLLAQRGRRLLRCPDQAQAPPGASSSASSTSGRR